MPRPLSKDSKLPKGFLKNLTHKEYYNAFSCFFQVHSNIFLKNYAQVLLSELNYDIMHNFAILDKAFKI